MPPRTKFQNVSPKAALKKMAQMVNRGATDPTVIKAAKAITSKVAARDDLGEIQAVFDAVKSGTDAVPGLESGVRYVADPRDTDYYTGPAAMLANCADGACGGDCDDQSILVASLLAALGFPVGLRGYASSGVKGDFDHVYAVVSVPKEGTTEEVLGLDTTVPSSYVGWEPPEAYVLTAWVY
jgi:hypothetical protein